jgi:non-ribosomal peptide synthetase component F
MFTLDNASRAPLSLPGLTVTEVPVGIATSKLDLLLSLTETPDGITGWLEYATDLFDEATVARMGARFETLLGRALAAPDAPIGDLDVLPDAERRLLLAWNDTAFSHASDLLLHEAFAARAAETPGVVALRFDGHGLTYGELCARVNRLAHALRRRGVQPDVLAAVLLPRSVEMVVALLAVLAAGGGYVPLDPEHPEERIAFMLADAQPRVLLTTAALARALPPHDAEVLCLDTDEGVLAAGPAHDPPRDGLGLDHLAYVIYTSGSTGRPKGAMNAHRGVLNRLCWMQRAFGLGAGDRVVQKTPVSFDVSVWELFWPLMSGACLVVAPPGAHRDPAALAALVEA